MTAIYKCPGITMPQPHGAPDEGYVACYRAGHECDRTAETRIEKDGVVIVTYNCPCCGSLKGAHCHPVGWQ